jgi:hypothetical protein
MAYNTGGEEQRIEKAAFPWEFTVPLSGDTETFTFSLDGHKADGDVVAITPVTTLERTASAAELGAARECP